MVALETRVTVRLIYIDSHTIEENKTGGQKQSGESAFETMRSPQRRTHLWALNSHRFEIVIFARARAQVRLLSNTLSCRDFVSFILIFSFYFFFDTLATRTRFITATAVWN